MNTPTLYNTQQVPYNNQQAIPYQPHAYADAPHMSIEQYENPYMPPQNPQYAAYVPPPVQRGIEFNPSNLVAPQNGPVFDPNLGLNFKQDTQANYQRYQ